MAAVKVSHCPQGLHSQQLPTTDFSTTLEKKHASDSSSLTRKTEQDLGHERITGSILTTESSRFPSLVQPEWIITSPYTEPQHQLNLRTLEAQDQLMCLALVSLEAARIDYAVCRYEDAFDWSRFMANLKSLAESNGVCWTKREYYVVEFRSKLKQDIDRDLLFKLDKESHSEAAQSGGLLKYWYGKPDSERRNLATCLWRNKDDAMKGGRGPWHKQARAVIPRMYEDINVKGLRLVIEDTVDNWHFSPYS